MRFTTNYHQIDRSEALDEHTYNQTEQDLINFLGKIISCEWTFERDGGSFSTKLHIHSNLADEHFESKGDFYYGVEDCLSKAKKTLKKSLGKLRSHKHNKGNSRIAA